jgi:hypothetical protein
VRQEISTKVCYSRTLTGHGRTSCGGLAEEIHDLVPWEELVLGLVLQDQRSRSDRECPESNQVRSFSMKRFRFFDYWPNGSSNCT